MDARQVFGTLPEGYRERITASFCSRCGSRCRPLKGDLPHTICTACGHMQFVQPSPGVTVVAVENEHVLLARRRARTGWGSFWCLPGGHVEFGEDFLTAGLRETLEETGVQVEITGLLSVVSNFWQHVDSTFVAVLLARPLYGAPASNSEMSEVAWFPWNALPDMAFEADVHIIERYFITRDQGALVDPDYARLEGRDASSTPPLSERHPR